MPAKPFRRGILAVFVNPQGEVLVGKRFGTVDAWQFPQGGIDAEESVDDALRREVFEEIGCQNFAVLKSLEHPIRYEFPTELSSKLAQKFRGQELYWFLCQLIGEQMPDLKLACDNEFDELAWVRPSHALQAIVPWKRQAYREGLRLLGFDLPDSN